MALDLFESLFEVVDALEHLIAMKVQAGRAQDLADVERLTELDR